MTTARAAVLGAVVVLGLACGGGGGEAGPAPTIVSRGPSPGITEVASTSVAVVFSEAMDAASLATGLTVARAGGGAIDGTVATLGDTAVFTPTTSFPAAADLTVSLSADVRSLRGGRLGTPVTWGFTTAHWRTMATAGAPTARTGHSAVWTGTQLVVWGGIPATLAGGRYAPATDTWRATTAVGAPAARSGHTAVWTGSEMIVWGGTVGAAPVNSGGRYDPATDSWRGLSTIGAPSARSSHSAVWTGSEMIVWGGAADLSGGRYDPASDTWRPMTLTGAPPLVSGERAVWTGTRLAVWGGSDGTSPGAGIGGAGISSCGGYGVAVGALYDPAGDTWTAIPSAGAPAGRSGHVLVWTGTELLVTGGAAGGGGRYSPASGTWTSMADAGAPTLRLGPHAAWTGSRLVVWAGWAPTCFAGPTLLDNGGLFDPQTDGWSTMPQAGSAASVQYGAASVWTGAELLVWGGSTEAIGARYTP